MRLLTAHVGVYVLGALFLWWVSSPVAAADWESFGAITWGWLLLPCLAGAVVAGLGMGVLAGRGRNWSAVAVLVALSVPALWMCAFYSAANLFGSTTDTTAELLVAALAGWTLFVVVSLLLAAALARRVSTPLRQPSELSQGAS